jgi:6-phosphogluconate dehydrogenase
MGQNLALNIDDHGFRVVVHNRTTERTEEFLAGPAAGTDIAGADTIADLVAAVATPRRIVVMVKAGAPVDSVISSLGEHLEPGDVIIDGGNSHWEDTVRRTAEAESRGLRYVGAGISGGEEGARHGPSIMPGGTPEAWPLVRDVLQAIAAKVDDGTPTCDWVGPDGAGHFVKMVHNGIEYGDIQVLAEAYHLLHAGLGMGHDTMAELFARWNRGRLESYLVEITADVMATREDGAPLLEKILDAAGQKGTGRWTVEEALGFGSPATLIAEAVFARVTSSLKEDRVAAHELLGGVDPIADDPAEVADDLEQAVYASKIVSYAQGFMLMDAASEERGWALDLGGIAIIRARFLDDIRRAFEEARDLRSLVVAPFFAEALRGAEPGWRRTVRRAVAVGIPVPAYSSALAFYDSYRSARLPANLIQALRDYFGAHTYERIDRPRGEWFHTDWTGAGGDVASGSYDA